MTGVRRASALEVLALALATACVTGLLHTAVLLWRLVVGREFIWQSRDHVWMAPIGYLLCSLALALPGGVAAFVARRVSPAFDTRRWFAGLFTFAGSLALLLLWPRLHPVAQAILALGIAVRASGPLARVSPGATSRAALALAGLVVALGLGSRAWRWGAERRGFAQLPPAAEGAPNVLLIILDTVRAASLSLHGHPSPTSPVLAALGTEGVVFDRAISAAPWTLPSHGSLFTGHDADSLGVSWRVPLGPTLPTLAGLFRDQGYSTAGFVANTYYAAHDSGLERGFLHYEDYRATLKQAIRSATFGQLQVVAEVWGSRSVREVLRALRKFDLTLAVMPLSHRKNGSMVTNDFLAWQATSGPRPFFAFLNYFDAHQSYFAPPPYDTLFPGPSRDIRHYEGAIRYMDDQLGRLFDSLRVRGVLDRTIVAVTSDHGEQFGEHGRTGHGNAMYMEVLHVPLVVRFPARVPKGVRVDHPVALQDLGATLLDLAGRGEAAFPGHSLAREWDGVGEAAPREIRSALTSYEDAWRSLDRQRSMQSVVVGGWHWMRDLDGTVSLYDLREDWAERRNLWGDAAMRSRFEEVQRMARSPRGPPAGS